MQHVERLAQESAVHNERYVGLRSTLRTSYYADTRASQCTKQLTCNTGGVLHVLTHNGDGSQSALSVHGEHGTRLYLLGKLLVQHLYGCFGILVANTNRRRVL